LVQVVSVQSLQHPQQQTVQIQFLAQLHLLAVAVVVEATTP
jgi:hypothetical protein